MPIFDPKQVEGFLVGTLLGDSYMFRDYSLACENISKGLILLKIKYLEHLLNKKINYYTRKRSPGKSVLDNPPIRTARPTFSFSVYSKSKFAFYKNLFYLNGKREPTEETLNLLNPAGIAVWLMDDGYLDFKKSSNTRNIRFCTDSFSIDTVNTMQNYFKNTWGIHSKIYMHIPKKGLPAKPRLSFNGGNSQKLVSLIYPHVLPEFYYKINLKYQQKTLYTKRIIESYRFIQEKLVRSKF